MHSKTLAARSSTGPRLRQPPFGSPTRRPQANGQASSHTRSWPARRPPGINQAAEHRFQATYGPGTGAFMSFGRTRTGFSQPSSWESIQISASSSARIRCSTVRPVPISIEFSDAAVKEIVARGWHVWERDGGVDKDRPVEILVGGTADSLLHYLAFERAALGEDQGHRHLLADKFAPPLAQGVPHPERQLARALPRARPLGT